MPPLPSLLTVSLELAVLLKSRDKHITTVYTVYNITRELCNICTICTMDSVYNVYNMCVYVQWIV